MSATDLNLPAAAPSRSPCKERLSAESACRVTFGCNAKAGEETFSAFVPDNLLWSAEGLAYMFSASREAFLTHPSQCPNEPSVEDAWASFHVIGIESIDGFVIEGIKTPEYQEEEALDEL